MTQTPRRDAPVRSRSQRKRSCRLHFANFIAAIRTGEKLTQPIESGNITVTMLQLSNIAWEVQRELKLNPENGHIVDDPGAMKFWTRKYENGWAPHL